MLRPANLILSAGTYVDKPGAHGLGRAFDLDGLLWDGRTFLALGYPHDTRFYVNDVNTPARLHAHLDEQWLPLMDASRKPIESAVTTFANHSATDEFLEQYR